MEEEDTPIAESCIRGRNPVVIGSQDESLTKEVQQLKKARDGRILDPKSMEGKIYMGVVKRELDEMNKRHTFRSSAFLPRSQNELVPGQEGGGGKLTEVEILHREIVEDIWSSMVVRAADKLRTTLNFDRFTSSRVEPVVINRNESLIDVNVKELQVREVLVIHQLFESVKTLMKNILADGELVIDSEINIHESPPKKRRSSLEPEANM